VTGAGEQPAVSGASTLDVTPVPPRSRAFARFLADHGVPPRGVVHVGAHFGEELETYLAYGFERILYVEANPAVFARLAQHVAFWNQWLEVVEERFGLARRPRITAVNCAAAERGGHAALHVAEQDPLSSILVPIDPSIRLRGHVEVEQRTVDDLVAAAGWPLSSISMLSVDAQGAEHLVLEGAAGLLRHIDLAIIEVNYRLRYEGGETVEQLDHRMEAAGFRQVLLTRPWPDYPAGDAVYRRVTATPR
jgi:FkbM family methyltransferase